MDLKSVHKAWSPGLLTSNERMTMSLGDAEKSRMGMGILLQMYSHTTSILYWGWGRRRRRSKGIGILLQMYSHTTSILGWCEHCYTHTHSFIHSLIHVFTHSFTHLLTYSLTHTLTLTHSLILSLTHSLTRNTADIGMMGALSATVPATNFWMESNCSLATSWDEKEREEEEEREWNKCVREWNKYSMISLTLCLSPTPFPSFFYCCFLFFFYYYYITPHHTTPHYTTPRYPLSTIQAMNLVLNPKRVSI